MTAQPSYDDPVAVDALLSGRGPVTDPLVGVLAALRTMAVHPAPQPTPALAALLAHGAAVDELAGRGRVRRALAGGVLACGATLTLSGVAAAHDLLPGPAQTVITRIVNTVTPFHISSHPTVSPAGPAPTPTSVSVPGGVHRPRPTPTRPATATAAAPGSVPATTAPPAPSRHGAGRHGAGHLPAVPHPSSSPTARGNGGGHGNVHARGHGTAHVTKPPTGRATGHATGHAAQHSDAPHATSGSGGHGRGHGRGAAAQGTATAATSRE